MTSLKPLSVYGTLESLGKSPRKFEFVFQGQSYELFGVYPIVVGVRLGKEFYDRFSQNSKLNFEGMREQYEGRHSTLDISESLSERSVEDGNNGSALLFQLTGCISGLTPSKGFFSNKIKRFDGKIILEGKVRNSDTHEFSPLNFNYQGSVSIDGPDYVKDKLGDLFRTPSLNFQLVTKQQHMAFIHR